MYYSYDSTTQIETTYMDTSPQNLCDSFFTGCDQDMLLMADHRKQKCPK